MLAMFRSRLVRPAGMTNEEFYGAWYEEAKATLEAMESGAIVSCYKVPGRDEVIGVVEVEDPDMLDRAVNSLPLWRRGYAYLVADIEWTLLRPYEHWASDLARLVSGDETLT